MCTIMWVNGYHGNAIEKKRVEWKCTRQVTLKLFCQEVAAGLQAPRLG
jgi:uncharacterized protein YbbK (DUF523 family)